MSINSAMLAGAAGMRANASALASISDNIANVNTVGFKRLRADFSSLLDSPSRQPAYSAGGVMSRSSPLMNEQGSTTASSVSTHLAVSGNGMFVVRGRSEDATSRDPYYYTRRMPQATICSAGRSTRRALSTPIRPISTPSSPFGFQALQAAPRRPRGCPFPPTCNRRRRYLLQPRRMTRPPRQTTWPLAR